MTIEERAKDFALKQIPLGIVDRSQERNNIEMWYSAVCYTQQKIDIDKACKEFRRMLNALEVDYDWMMELEREFKQAMEK